MKKPGPRSPGRPPRRRRRRHPLWLRLLAPLASLLGGILALLLAVFLLPREGSTADVAFGTTVPGGWRVDANVVVAVVAAVEAGVAACAGRLFVGEVVTVLVAAWGPGVPVGALVGGPARGPGTAAARITPGVAVVAGVGALVGVVELLTGVLMQAGVVGGKAFHPGPAVLAVTNASDFDTLSPIYVNANARPALSRTGLVQDVSELANAFANMVDLERGVVRWPLEMGEVFGESSMVECPEGVVECRAYIPVANDFEMECGVVERNRSVVGVGEDPVLGFYWGVAAAEERAACEEGACLWMASEVGVDVGANVLTWRVARAMDPVGCSQEGCLWTSLNCTVRLARSTRYESRQRATVERAVGTPFTAEEMAKATLERGNGTELDVVIRTWEFLKAKLEDMQIAGATCRLDAGVCFRASSADLVPLGMKSVGMSSEQVAFQMRVLVEAQFRALWASRARMNVTCTLCVERSVKWASKWVYVVAFVVGGVSVVLGAVTVGLVVLARDADPFSADLLATATRVGGGAEMVLKFRRGGMDDLTAAGRRASVRRVPPADPMSDEPGWIVEVENGEGPPVAGHSFANGIGPEISIAALALAMFVASFLLPGSGSEEGVKAAMAEGGAVSLHVVVSVATVVQVMMLTFVGARVLVRLFWSALSGDGVPVAALSVIQLQAATSFKLLVAALFTRHAASFALGGVSLGVLGVVGICSPALQSALRTGETWSTRPSTIAVMQPNATNVTLNRAREPLRWEKQAIVMAMADLADGAVRSDGPMVWRTVARSNLSTPLVACPDFADCRANVSLPSDYVVTCRQSQFAPRASDGLWSLSPPVWLYSTVKNLDGATLQWNVTRLADPARFGESFALWYGASCTIQMARSFRYESKRNGTLSVQVAAVFEDQADLQTEPIAVHDFYMFYDTLERYLSARCSYPITTDDANRLKECANYLPASDWKSIQNSGHLEQQMRFALERVARRMWTLRPRANVTCTSCVAKRTTWAAKDQFVPTVAVFTALVVALCGWSVYLFVAHGAAATISAAQILACRAGQRFAQTFWSGDQAVDVGADRSAPKDDVVNFVARVQRRIDEEGGVEGELVCLTLPEQIAGLTWRRLPRWSRSMSSRRVAPIVKR
ncbi:hypothetical protein HDU96_009738 [Phlyctochytrium bullatum]|nr:hypothetical protein HDU96_009738 [Phlyctochytrium bullatum]